jgi:hypothetical protein
MSDDYAQWLKDNSVPDLQAMVRLAGERYFALSFTDFDPIRTLHAVWWRLLTTCIGTFPFLHKSMSARRTRRRTWRAA